MYFEKNYSDYSAASPDDTKEIGTKTAKLSLPESTNEPLSKDELNWPKSVSSV